MSCAINKRGFLRLYLCWHTFASLWCANSCGDSCVLSIHLSNICWGLLILSSYLKAFVFQKFAVVCYSVFIKCSSFKVCWIFIKRRYFMSLLKVCYQSVFVESLKFYFGLILHIFQHFVWKICATPGAYIIQGCLAERPLYHKVNLPGYVAWCLLCHKVNLPRCSKSSEMWGSAVLFHPDLWYFRHQTNKHFSSKLFIQKNW